MEKVLSRKNRLMWTKRETNLFKDVGILSDKKKNCNSDQNDRKLILNEKLTKKFF